MILWKMGCTPKKNGDEKHGVFDVFKVLSVNTVIIIWSNHPEPPEVSGVVADCVKAGVVCFKGRVRRILGVTEDFQMKQDFKVTRSRYRT